MNFLSRLERRLGWLAIHNITVIIVFGQACAFLLYMVRPQILFAMALIPSLVMRGEVWRLFSFIFFPPSTNLLFAFFDLYFLYFMGQALEANWGAFRYNVYLLIAYVMTVAAAFVQPDMGATNIYIGGSVFLAFAYLYPDFEILLFLILPIKAKWAAWATWALYLYSFVMGDIQTKLIIVASVLNFLLFFGFDIIQHVRTGHRRLKTHVAKVQDRDKPFHVCAVCGKTDKTHPKMDFRYCPMCVGSWGYCPEHLLNHEHKTHPPGES
ncbi:MAG TPA: hypothetical protein VG722_08470 [Tepidisphaeraceae bacterium]|nr:hypothetical protein [Tepidisphaeraceae bacterium]